MPRLPETVSVHEKVVQAVAEGSLAPLPRRRRSSAEGHPLVINDFRVTIHPAVWERVRHVSRACLQILGPTDVIAWNHPNTEEYPWPTIR